MTMTVHYTTWSRIAMHLLAIEANKSADREQHALGGYHTRTALERPKLLDVEGQLREV